MNKLLLNNRPKDSSIEEFTKAWNNASYTLEALFVTLKQLQDENEKVNKDDFDCPNHYAKLAYQAGMCKAYDTIIKMLPESAKA
jgi:hypothetical protein